MRIFVTGGAGFVGSNLCERLLKAGHEVSAYDNLSAGSLDLLRDCTPNRNFRFVKADLLDLQKLETELRGHDVVFHLAANSDIQDGLRNPDTDFRLGTVATFNVLEGMRRSKVSKLVFSSSSVIYGEPAQIPTSEDYGPLLPISLYGASKLACEGLISAFCHNYGMQAWMFRFANICGRHGTHGAIVDFIRKLRKDPKRLEILGDGKQAKPYLHVSECVDGMIHGWQHSSEPVNYFNLGCEGATSVSELARYVIGAIGLTNVAFEFTGGSRGWPGDVPQVRLDCSKMERIGWKARMTSSDAVQRAATELVEEFKCKQ
jgi:UDP-glucose 4-epimerase